MNLLSALHEAVGLLSVIPWMEIIHWTPVIHWLLTLRK